MNHNKIFTIIFPFLVVTNITITFASKEFEITPVEQEKTLWCWAACCEMVFDAYQMATYGFYGSVDQYDAADWAVNGENNALELGGSDTSVDQVLLHFGSIVTQYYEKSEGVQDACLDEYDITWEIDDGRPILASVAVVDIDGDAYLHDVLIKGYSGSGGYNVGNVIYNNPESGEREYKSYDNFVSESDDSWAWYETLTFISDPREAIPLGVGSNHRVTLYDEDCTTGITTSTQSLSYRAVKNGDTPVTWIWKLSFPSSVGQIAVASCTTSTTVKDFTWDISNFSLPSGYDWIYMYNGQIGGKIKVICLDPDYHADAITVTYTPSSLYPGILRYENKTISSAQSDVKAHQRIIMNNDTFCSGSNVSFKCGERIDIVSGVTFQNGSLTNLIIDTSLR